jgi:hypothetical protein
MHVLTQSMLDRHDITEILLKSGVKHHQTNKQTINVSQMKIIICLLALSICIDMIKHSFFLIVHNELKIIIMKNLKPLFHNK